MIGDNLCFADGIVGIRANAAYAWLDNEPRKQQNNHIYLPRQNTMIKMNEEYIGLIDHSNNSALVVLKTNREFALMRN